MLESFVTPNAWFRGLRLCVNRRYILFCCVTGRPVAVKNSSAHEPGSAFPDASVRAILAATPPVFAIPFALFQCFLCLFQTPFVFFFYTFRVAGFSWRFFLLHLPFVTKSFGFRGRFVVLAHHTSPVLISPSCPFAGGKISCGFFSACFPSCVFCFFLPFPAF